MEIDISNININDDLEIVVDKNLTNNNNGNILNEVDNKIENAIFDLGLDKYLLSINKIYGGQMQLIIAKYRAIYRTKKYRTPDIVNHAYDYVIGILKNSYVYKDNLMVTDGKNCDALSIINKLYNDYNNKDEFINLNDFIKYYNQKEMTLKRK